jgi:hypothetical protein
VRQRRIGQPYELHIHPVSHQFDSHFGARLVVISFCEKDRAHTAAAKLSYQYGPTRAGALAAVLVRWNDSSATSIRF